MAGQHDEAALRGEIDGLKLELVRLALAVATDPARGHVPIRLSDDLQGAIAAGARAAVETQTAAGSKKLDSAMQHLGSEAETVAARLADIAGRIEHLGAAAQAADARATGLIDWLDAQGRGLEANMRAAANAIAAAAARSDSAVAQLETQRRALDSATGTATARLGEVDSRSAELIAQIDAQRAAVEGVGTTAAQGFAAVQARLAELETRIAALATQAEAAKITIRTSVSNLPRAPDLQSWFEQVSALVAEREPYGRQPPGWTPQNLHHPALEMHTAPLQMQSRDEPPEPASGDDPSEPVSEDDPPPPPQNSGWFARVQDRAMAPLAFLRSIPGTGRTILGTIILLFVLIGVGMVVWSVVRGRPETATAAKPLAQLKLLEDTRTALNTAATPWLAPDSKANAEDRPALVKALADTSAAVTKVSTEQAERCNTKGASKVHRALYDQLVAALQGVPPPARVAPLKETPTENDRAAWDAEVAKAALLTEPQRRALAQTITLRDLYITALSDTERLCA